MFTPPPYPLTHSNPGVHGLPWVCHWVGQLGVPSPACLCVPMSLPAPMGPLQPEPGWEKSSEAGLGQARVHRGCDGRPTLCLDFRLLPGRLGPRSAGRGRPGTRWAGGSCFPTRVGVSALPSARTQSRGPESPSVTEEVASGSTGFRLGVGMPAAGRGHREKLQGLRSRSTPALGPPF